MNRIRAIFRPPTLVDIAQNARARSLYWITIGLLISGFFTLFLPLFFSPANISWTIVFTIVAVGVVINSINLFLLHRGLVNLVGGILIFFNWIAYIGVAAKTGGVQSPAFPGVILVAVMAALFLGHGAGLIVNILSGCAGIWLLSVAPDQLQLPSLIARGRVELGVTMLIAIMATFVAGAATRTIQFSMKKVIDSESRYRMLIQESPDGILIINLEGNIILANPGAARLLGFLETNDLIGLSIISIFDPNELALRPVPDADKLKSGEVFRGERTINKPGGEQITILGSVRQMPDDNYQFLFQDITARKRNEAERERMIAELDAKNSELERYSYTVSHDLKTPLITIRNFIGFLKKDLETGDPAKIESDLRFIDQASDDMNKLLNDLLDFTRIGQLMNVAEWVSYHDIVQEALVLVKSRNAMDHFSIEVDPTLPDVYGDRMRLVDVLKNLIENAVKFMGEQPMPLIHIGRITQNDQTIFFVKDNGIGIPDVYYERIFGMFDRLDPNMDGTGIGLSLVKRIVELHNGEIWVESDGAGNGSTFYFTLRLTPDTSHAAENPGHQLSQINTD